MNMTKLNLCLVAVSLLAQPALAVLKPYEKTFSRGKVTFYKEESMTAEQFSAAPAKLKPDAAWLQTYAPLTMAMRNAVTAADFNSMTQEEMDQFYIRLTSGPIVPGSYRGLVYQRAEAIQQIKKFALNKYHKTAFFGSALCGGQDLVECFAELGWKGKRIYAPDPTTGEYQVRNAISLPFASTLKTFLMPISKQIDPKNWLRRTKDDFYGTQKNMIFPAHLYCGQSLLDHRRESIIIDYSWGSDFSPFIDGLDNIVGRNFLDIRDEVRMVRPGLYFGRAYIQKIFVLNFTLNNLVVDKPNATANPEVSWPADACFNPSKSTR